jgi:putrescine transport system substrate-binding protein
MRWIDTAAIPADAPHPQAALAFLDFLMRPAEIASLSNEIAYANANRAALPLLKPAIRENPAIYPDAATQRRLATPAAFAPAQQRLRTQTWTRIKSGL